jgi:small subunit ribosomal protein S4
MAKNLGSKCKLCRRAGEKLFLKGDRCASPKCAVVRKPYAPGAHGQTRSRGLSEFGKQLAEKQKLKRIYGLSEAQLRRHLREAQKKSGVVGDNLIIRIEMRLDNVVHRLGFADSRAQARQLVGHGCFTVNKKHLDIASAKVVVGDEIVLKETKAGKNYFTQLQTVLAKKQDIASWLSFDAKTMSGKVLSAPNKDDVAMGLDLAAVIEYYSR